MIHTLLKETVRKVTYWLVNEEYDKIMNNVSTRCQKEDIERVIRGYLGVFTMPSEEAFKNFYLMEIEEEKEFRIEFNLWYDGEESDLSLILNVEIEHDFVKEVELVDIRVM